MPFFGCSGQIESEQLLSFKKEYHVALVCAVRDPNIDQLTDKRIVVSPLFEIVSGPIAVFAPSSPSGVFSVPIQGTITIDYMPILVPRNVKWEKITTLSDLIQMGGKVLDPRYY